MNLLFLAKFINNKIKKYDNVAKNLFVTNPSMSKDSDITNPFFEKTQSYNPFSKPINLTIIWIDENDKNDKNHSP